VKKRFLRFFLFWSGFLTFFNDLHFPNVFFIFKNIGKFHSGKQINKK